MKWRALLLMAFLLGSGLLRAQEGAAPQTPAAAAPPPAAAPSSITLGEFAVKVATQLQLPAPGSGFTPEAAAWALLQKGVRVRPELGSPLVEGDVVAILTGLGYHIRTTTPSRVMTRDRLDAIVTVFFPAHTPAPGQ
jgi:hypothetical protein